MLDNCQVQYLRQTIDCYCSDETEITFTYPTLVIIQYSKFQQVCFLLRNAEWYDIRMDFSSDENRSHGI